MDVNRWNQIDAIFQSLLEQSPEDRAAFLDEVCSGDESLRKEIEAYISYDEQTWSLLDCPAFEVAAPILSQTRAILYKGQHLAHYEVLDLIGVGGMGEVYLAQDTILGRKVALKLLPENFTRSDLLVERFRQEARAVSSLNHPNILTIYEIAQEADHHYIATEFIEGETLRRRMQRDRLSLHESLDIAVQVASALAAAHQAGIIHRDIKPENIMLRTDGYVKVLDFGLAKLIIQQGVIQEGDEQADFQTNNSSGLLLGTVRYMSPEQASRQEVDARSDIFSFAVMLYEMLTGCPLFAGETNQDLIASICRDEPTPVQNYSAEIPDALQQSLNKALSKKKEGRYQKVEELLHELESIKGELERQSSTQENTSQARAVSKSNRYRFTVALVIALILIGTSAYLLVKLWGKNSVPFQQLKMVPLQISEKADMASISHDGKYVCYVVKTDRRSLWIRELATNQDKQIIPPVDQALFEPVFSPEDAYIYYLTQPKGTPAPALMRISVSGGEPEQVLEKVHRSPGFSTDGERIAFTAKLSKEESALMMVNLKTSERQMLATHKSPEYFSNLRPTWSPDGKVIVSIIGTTAGNGEMNLMEFQVESGTKKELSSHKWKSISGVLWHPNHSGLLLSAAEYGEDPVSHIWYLSYPEGELQKLTNDKNTYDTFSITRDSEKLLAVADYPNSSVWVLPDGDSSRAVSISQGGLNRFRFVSWTPDGKIVFPSNAGGDRDIWIMASDGTEKRQLTANARNNLHPSVSPDNRYIVFSSNRSEASTFNIWRMNIDGTNPVQLTHGSGEIHPRYSPDGRWIVYTKGGPDEFPTNHTVWKMSIDGGEPVQLTDKPSTWPDISPDGKLISCWYEQSPNTPWAIAILSPEGGRPLKIFNVPSVVVHATRWMPNGQSVTYIVKRGEVSNIWSQPLTGGEPKQLTSFISDNINNFDWSKDGTLLCARQSHEVNIMLITNLK